MAATNSKDLVLSYERADGKTHNMTMIFFFPTA